MEDKERQQGRSWRGVLVLVLVLVLARGAEYIGQLDDVVDNVGIKMSRQ